MAWRRGSGNSADGSGQTGMVSLADGSGQTGIVSLADGSGQTNACGLFLYQVMQVQRGVG